jgi:FxsC-like protein
MTGYLFFFSYARDDGKNPYFLKFYEELLEEIRTLTGRPVEQIGFLDRNNVVLGEPWQPAMVESLQSSRVMLSLYSPTYFKREYCGKEWQVFRLRQDLYGAPRPPGTHGVILPLLWVAPSDLTEAPPATSAVQFNHASLGARYEELGLRQLRTVQKFRDDYRLFMLELARVVKAASDQHAQLPRLNPDPVMDQVLAAFPPLQTPASDESEERLGPSHTKVVFVAATKQEMETLQQRNSLQAYGESAHDWRPFSLDPARSIRDFVTDAIAEENKGGATDPMTFHELSVGGRDEDTIEYIKAAEARKNPVVVVVDPWSLKIDRDFEFMRALDAVNSPAVLIVWDSHDQEMQAKRAELGRLLREEAIPKGCGSFATTPRTLISISRCVLCCHQSFPPASSCNVGRAMGISENFTR